MNILNENNKLSEEFKKALFKGAREAVKEGKAATREQYLAYALSRGKPYRLLEASTEWDKIRKKLSAGFDRASGRALILLNKSNQ